MTLDESTWGTPWLEALVDAVGFDPAVLARGGTATGNSGLGLSVGADVVRRAEHQTRFSSVNARTETAVMVSTVVVVVLTHNLAYGVGVGVLLSAVFFVRHVSHVVRVTSMVDPDNTERLFSVTGELFFASTNDLVHSFDYDSVKVKRVEIDLSRARIWDSSSVAALDTVVAKFAERGIEAHLTGLNRHAEHLHWRTTGKMNAGH